MGLIRNICFVLLSFITVACSNSRSSSEKDVLARVGEQELSLQDIQDKIPYGVNSEDSVRLLKSIVDDWVSTQLLYQRANLNIEDRDKQLEKQIQSYKEELYIHKFEQFFMNQNLDTILSKQMIKDFYLSHSNEFTLSQPAVKPLFIVFPKDLDLTKAKRWFYSSRPEDVDNLKDYTYQFSPKFYFEDTWLEYNSLLQEIPIEDISSSRLFSPYGAILQDTMNYYYIRITEFVEKGKIAPQELVEDDIVKILLHKRKLKLIKDMRNKIYQDALHKKEFEIFIAK